MIEPGASYPECWDMSEGQETDTRWQRPRSWWTYLYPSWVERGSRRDLALCDTTSRVLSDDLNMLFKKDLIPAGRATILGDVRY